MSTEKLVPSLTSTVFSGQRIPSFALLVVLVVDAGSTEDVYSFRLVKFVPDLDDLLVPHDVAWDFVLATTYDDLCVAVHWVNLRW